MSNHGFDPQTVTYAIQDLSGPTIVNADCTSVYGDSGRILTASQNLAAVGGGLIGSPADPSFSNGIPCSSMVGGMFPLAYYYPAPSVFDFHSGPCLKVLDSNNQYICDTDQSNNANEAQYTLTHVKAMLDTWCPGGWRLPIPQLCQATVKIEANRSIRSTVPTAHFVTTSSQSHNRPRWHRASTRVR
jgi:hypothetical protein